MNYESSIPIPIPTPHNEAAQGDIAKTVLMPGDPLRARVIAENYLEDASCFNSVRGMLGFTGKYKGTEVSVMGSGMGMPSIGIYSYELYGYYGVENIIRIGSCGAYLPEINVYDLILATEARSESTFYEVMTGKGDKTLYPSTELNDVLLAKGNELSARIITAPITSSDVFYNMRGDYYKKAAQDGSVAVEMEAFGLFANACALGKRAACLLAVSDNIVTGELISAEYRQNAFNRMMEIALEAAIAL